MNERLARIRATVQELEQELRELDSLDPTARLMLQGVAREIHAVLGDRDLPPAAHRTLHQRLQDAAHSFESSHPALAGVLERVVDALAQLGI